MILRLAKSMSASVPMTPSLPSGLTIDPSPDTRAAPNLYLYAANNPLVFADPSGRVISRYVNSEDMRDNGWGVTEWGFRVSNVDSKMPLVLIQMIQGHSLISRCNPEGLPMPPPSSSGRISYFEVIGVLEAGSIHVSYEGTSANLNCNR